MEGFHTEDGEGFPKWTDCSSTGESISNLPATSEKSPADN